jgi:N-acylneuraminate cytidylyltransferase
MKNIAIIPARGGSKRIPRKNIKPFCGKPIITYSIEAALRSGLFDVVMVSTDDEDIAAVAKAAGAEVPFMRSEKNSDDYAGTVDVLLEVLTAYEKQNTTFDNVCCIYPTAPFVNTQRLSEAYQMLNEKQYDSVFPICAFSFPILRALQLSNNNQVSMIWPENMTKRSQDLPPAYHDAGQFYWCRTLSLTTDKKLYTDNSGAIVLNETEVQDIDNESDWLIAEMKFKLLAKK